MSVGTVSTRKKMTDLLCPEAEALEHGPDVSERQHNQRVLETRVRDLGQHVEHVLFRSDVAHRLEERVLFRWGHVLVPWLAPRLLVLAPRLSLVVSEVEGLHDLLSSHEGLHRLLGHLGRLGIVCALALVGGRPVDRVGDVGVVQLLELLLALLLEEELEGVK